MKTLAVRLSVLTLALSGFAATTVVSKASSSKIDIKPTHTNVVSPPMCMPRDPSHCGMD